MNTPTIAYLGLGSNLAEPKVQIQKACQWLAADPSVHILKQAPLYQTPAWGVTNQADFINTALQITTTLPAAELLNLAKNIEYKKMGRQVNQRWHERVIDIDILLYGEQSIDSKELTIPHPYIAERWFVILPLLTLNPKLPESLEKAIQIKTSQEKPPKSIKIIT